MGECTPRARKVARGDPAPTSPGGPSRTPRAGRLAAREATAAASGSPPPLGFTLSYLRRVPELAVLAQRVVRAEARRREKAARGASQRQASASSGAGKDAGKDAGAGKGKGKAVEASKEGVRPKMKRLFIWAILKLYEEGSIVLWDEGARPIPRARATARRSGGGEEAVGAEVSRLWKMSVGTGGDASADGASSVFGGGGGREDDAGELTDPWEGEEAYVPLTATYLAAQVEGVLRAAMFGPEAAAAMSAGGSASASASARVGRREVRGSGLTVEGITRSLRASDGRWERVGAWAVQEAVGLLKAGGKVWCVGGEGGGRWELCL